MSDDLREAVDNHADQVSQYHTLESEQDREFYLRKLAEIVDGDDQDIPDLSNIQQVRSLELSAIGYGANLSEIAENAMEKDRYYE